jgi:hypothetical protein
MSGPSLFFWVKILLRWGKKVGKMARGGRGSEGQKKGRGTQKRRKKEKRR